MSSSITWDKEAFIGRYPVHFHMGRKVPQPTRDSAFQGTYIADSSIHDSMTRFITVHATQELLISRNVGYRSIGHLSDKQYLSFSERRVDVFQTFLDWYSIHGYEVHDDDERNPAAK